MDGPEHLEVGRAPRRRRSGWLPAGVVLVVVVGLAVVRLGGATWVPRADRAPSPTASSSAWQLPPTTAAPAAKWPTGLGLGSGTLYALADGEVYAIDVSGGLVQPLGLKADTSETVLTPLLGGVLAWSTSGGPKRYVLFPGGTPLRPADPLGSAAVVLPGAGGSVWVGTQDPDHRTTWLEADDAGPTGARLQVRGLALPDGAGGLFDQARSEVHHVDADGRQDLGEGYLLAVGPDGYLMDSCAGGTCVPDLHQRSGDLTTAVGPPAAADPERAAALLVAGALSPGNRFLAEPVSTSSGGGVQVSRVEPGLEVLRIFPAGSQGGAFTWLSDRWLATTSGEGLVLYDAVDQTVLTPQLPFGATSRLVFAPA